MAPRGGYRKTTTDEWVKTTRQHYAEAIRSADQMKQDLTIWMGDAISHHVYRCEIIGAKARHAEASREAAAAMRPSPLESDYLPTRPAPTITRSEGQGSPTSKRQQSPRVLGR